MDYWTITPEWQGAAVFIVAGGTSVKQQDLNLLRGHHVIALNSSYESVPFADFLFFADRRWYFDHWKRPAFVNFAGRKVTCRQDVITPGIANLRRVLPPVGYAVEPDSVVSNRTCLQGAMNMAGHLGARRLVLLGADMRRADDGSTHHHKPHLWRNKPGNASWDAQMTQLALIVEPLKERGIEVINTSSISRIDWWPKMTLEESLAVHLQHAA